MKIAKIADLANLADGSVIGEIRVQIKKAFPPKIGEGKYGPWRVQNCIIVDGTGEGKASFWTNDDMTKCERQTVTIRSQASAKGLTGVTVAANKQTGQNELKVTDKAAILDDTAGAVQDYVRSNAVATGVQVGGDVKDAKGAIFQRAQLYTECFKAAQWVAKTIDAVTPEHFQAIVASLFISSDKANLWANFPAKQSTQAPKEDAIPMDDHKDEFLEEAGW